MDALGSVEIRSETDPSTQALTWPLIGQHSLDLEPVIAEELRPLLERKRVLMRGIALASETAVPYAPRGMLSIADEKTEARAGLGDASHLVEHAPAIEHALDRADAGHEVEAVIREREGLGVADDRLCLRDARARHLDRSAREIDPRRTEAAPHGRTEQEAGTATDIEQMRTGTGLEQLQIDRVRRLRTQVARTASSVGFVEPRSDSRLLVHGGRGVSHRVSSWGGTSLRASGTSEYVPSAYDRRMSERQATAYWVVEPGIGELRTEVLRRCEPSAGQSLVRADYSGVSCGTERLVGLGLVPAGAAEVMACRAMAGSFALPVKYGYCLVATGVEGPLTDKRVFAMHPHQDFTLLDEGAVVLPDCVPSRRATLIPNLETALNAVWDAELREDDRTVVIGAGIVGLLVSYVLSHRGFRATLVDTDPERCAFANALPWTQTATTAIDEACCDVAFHSSGHGTGLQSAIDAVSFEGRVVELSWYGTRTVTLDLGGGFHYDRKRILASQVAHVAPAKRATHGPTERLAEVLELLEDTELDNLISRAIPFARLPDVMRSIYDGSCRDVHPIVSYE